MNGNWYIPFDTKRLPIGETWLSIAASSWGTEKQAEEDI